ncbi:MAG: hypothetical protein ACREYE_31545 [Gammaproteobacteria bacterium]
MSVQNDLLIGSEFKKHIDDPIFLVDAEYRVKQMLELSKFMPLNMAIIEYV